VVGQEVDVADVVLAVALGVGHAGGRGRGRRGCAGGEGLAGFVARLRRALLCGALAWFGARKGLLIPLLTVARHSLLGGTLAESGPSDGRPCGYGMGRARTVSSAAEPSPVPSHSQPPSQIQTTTPLSPPNKPG
jgi:hypothetical protein